MTGRPKPGPVHSTMVVTPVDAGQLDQEVHQQIYELLGIDNQVQREAFSEALNAWGREAYRFYESEKLLLSDTVVQATVHKIAKSAEQLSSLLAQADTQSGGALVIARALLRGKNQLGDREAPNDVVALNQMRQSVSALCQIAKQATENIKPAKGPKPKVARYLSIALLVQVIEDTTSKAVKRRISRDNGRPEGAVIKALRLCMDRFERLSDVALDDSLRKIPNSHG